jgi:antitoxin component YwqK of YwqJK toxin-antitoxin module
MYERNYKDGKLDGKMTLWEYGQRKSVVNFKDGKIDGKVTVWPATALGFSIDSNGEAYFKDGKCISGDCDHGLFRDFSN